MEDIQIVDISLDDIMGTKEVAEELGVDYREALVLMSKGVIPSERINGWITLRQVLKNNKYKLAKQN